MHEFLAALDGIYKSSGSSNGPASQAVDGPPRKHGSIPTRLYQEPHNLSLGFRNLLTGPYPAPLSPTGPPQEVRNLPTEPRNLSMDPPQGLAGPPRRSEVRNLLPGPQKPRNLSPGPPRGGSQPQGGGPGPRARNLFWGRPRNLCKRT